MEVALTLSLPLALLATLFVMNNPNIAAGLACVALVSLAFGVALLLGYFGNYRKRKLGVNRADA